MTTFMTSGMVITSGKNRVLYHGSVMSFNGEPVTIKTEFTTIEFDCKHDPEGNQGYGCIIGEKETNITLWNIRSSRYPITTPEPLFLGNIGDRLSGERLSGLYLNYSANWFQETLSVLISFTLYRGPEIDV